MYGKPLLILFYLISFTKCKSTALELYLQVLLMINSTIEQDRNVESRWLLKAQKAQSFFIILKAISKKHFEKLTLPKTVEGINLDL